MSHRWEERVRPVSWWLLDRIQWACTEEYRTIRCRKRKKKTMRALQKLEIKNIHTSRENQQSILSKYNTIKSKSVRKGRFEHNTHFQECQYRILHSILIKESFSMYSCITFIYTHLEAETVDFLHILFKLFILLAWILTFIPGIPGGPYYQKERREFYINWAGVNKRIHAVQKENNRNKLPRSNFVIFYIIGFL